MKSKKGTRKIPTFKELAGKEKQVTLRNEQWEGKRRTKSHVTVVKEIKGFWRRQYRTLQRGLVRED